MTGANASQEDRFVVLFFFMWNLLGGALGALGSIYGANVQAKEQQQTNMMNYDIGLQNMQNTANMNAANIAFQQQTNEQNREDQFNFAQNSKTWGAQDVMNAARVTGLNPLSLLGMGSSSFSNLVAPQGQSPQNTAVMKTPSGMAEAYSQAGQSLGRAISAIQSPLDQQYDQATKALTLQKASLENDLLRSQINKLNAPGHPPGVPPMDEPGVKPGVLPDVQMAQMPSGDYTPVPPKEIGSLGFFHPASLYWTIQNMMLPTFGLNKPASRKDDWFNPATGSYQKANPYFTLPSGGYGGSYDPSSDPWR